MTGRERTVVTAIRRGLRRGRSAVALLGAAALVASLSSGVTAASLLTGRDIADGSVTGRDVRDGTVGGVDVRDGSLTPRDYTGSVVGPAGPAGPAGPDGAIGPQGAAAVSGAAWKAVSATASPGLGNAVIAQCAPDDVALSGGIRFNVSNDELTITQSAPLNNGTGWYGAFRNHGTTPLTGYVWALCV